MKKTLILCLLLIFPLLFSGNVSSAVISEADMINATHHGVLTFNSGEANSRALQALIDSLSETGGTVYIPAGEYRFAENGSQTIGSHCIKMRSDVSIIGDGEATVLKPVGNSYYGLDMFYFNDYLDTGEATYLENCRFESFVIDASETSCEVYTSAGKGFMFNLFKNCHWKNVTVKYTDATGFGVDCPLNSTISHCTAIGCGKAAKERGSGASGFGIGFGYCDGEGIVISDCTAIDNKNFGFFFEHQGRFDEEKYNALSDHSFTITDCEASGNLFGFGGIHAVNTVYKNCTSESSRRYGFFFENSMTSGAEDCQSRNDREASFAVAQIDHDYSFEGSGIAFVRCTGEISPIGVKISDEVSATPFLDVAIDSCRFDRAECTVYAIGVIKNLTLMGNVSDTNQNNLSAAVERLVNSDNTWN